MYPTHAGADSIEAALKGADVIVVPAGVPRKPGMTRDDLFNINATIVKTIAEASAKVGGSGSAGSGKSDLSGAFCFVILCFVLFVLFCLVWFLGWRVGWLVGWLVGLAVGLHAAHRLVD